MLSQLLRFLWCVAVIIMAGILVRGHPIADQTSNNTEDNGYYNIYSKIDSLEKSLQNLQTGVKNRNKLFQQVFLAIAEFNADPAMTDVDLKSLVLQTKSKNGNVTSSFFIIYFHFIYLFCLLCTLHLRKDRLSLYIYNVSLSLQTVLNLQMVIDMFKGR